MHGLVILHLSETGCLRFYQYYISGGKKKAVFEICFSWELKPEITQRFLTLVLEVKATAAGEADSLGNVPLRC